MKRCTKCRQVKFLGEFGRTGKYTQSWCRECEAAYRALPEQRAKAVCRASAWAAANPTRRAEHRRRIAARRQAEGLRAADCAKRHAAKMQRRPSWLSQADKAEIDGMYHFAQVMRRITGREYHVDHEIPLQGKMVSGLHVPANLRVVPARVNLRKSNTYVSA